MQQAQTTCMFDVSAWNVTCLKGYQYAQLRVMLTMQRTYMQAYPSVTLHDRQDSNT